MKENTFSNFSMTNLETAHGDLIALFRRVITVIDCRVLEGHRSPKRQHELFLAGMSKIDWKTAPGKEPWNPGRHGSTPSSAVDVAPYPINWSNTKRFYHFAGIVRGIASKMDIPLRWGGDWDGDMDLDDQNFMDLVHFEREDRRR